MTTDRASRAGKLTFEGDYATLTFERHLRHPIDVVWETLTDPEHLAQWFMTRAQLEARTGGLIEFTTGPARVHVTGRILVWDPPRVFEHEWNVEPQKDLPQGEESIVRWELRPEGDTTLLRFSHRHLTNQTARIFAGGMAGFLDRLEDQLDGRPLHEAMWMKRASAAFDEGSHQIGR